MSKIGKLPIRLPEGVTIKTGEGWAEVVGPKGSIRNILHEKALVKTTAGEAVVEMTEGNLLNIHGTTRALLSNMVRGVTEGWAKTVELSGTGYRAGTTGAELQLALGFSHPVVIKAPQGINFEVKENRITVLGIDKITVGEVAAKIRDLKPADPYKAKGFKYEGEIIIRKVGKAAKAAA